MVQAPGQGEAGHQGQQEDHRHEVEGGQELVGPHRDHRWRGGPAPARWSRRGLPRHTARQACLRSPARRAGMPSPRRNGAGRGPRRQRRQAGLRPVGLADRDCAVEPHYRAGGEATAARRTTPRSAPSRSRLWSGRPRAGRRSRPVPGIRPAGRGPARPAGSSPFGDQAGVPARSVLLGERHQATSGPVRTRGAHGGAASARAAPRPRARRSSESWRVSRIASAARSTSAVALVEHEVEHAQHRRQIAGLVERHPAIRRLARLIRCAMVASGTR